MHGLCYPVLHCPASFAWGIASAIKTTFTAMQEVFNTLIDSFIENKIGIADHFLSESLSLHLKENLATHYRDQLMLCAGTGNNKSVEHNKLFRSDMIYWLDREHNDMHENSFFDLVDDFVKHLNETCYTGITSYEFHYTLYEKGSFYKEAS